MRARPPRGASKHDGAPGSVRGITVPATPASGDAPHVDLRPGIERVRARREILTALMANPAVLEHEGFSDLLIAIFHVAEELAARQDLGALPADDAAHLALDVERVYPMLVAEWLTYLRHLQEDYPHLFSLAARTNPFDPRADVQVRRVA